MDGNIKNISDEEQCCLQHCSSYIQYETMRRSFENECGFCKIDPTVNKILYTDEHWILWENAFPGERPCEIMLVIATKQHLRSLSKISCKAWTSFYDLLQWVEDKYDLPGGMLFMRFGDMRLNGGTVPHLHWNLWVPDETENLHARIYKKDTGGKKDKDRTTEFAKKYKSEKKHDA